MIAPRALIALALALQSLVGIRLDEAISLLQREGLTIIYSTALVKPEMRVRAEPRASTPRGKLEEILEPYGLRVADGPHHELLVVAGTRPAPPPPRLEPIPQFRDEIVVMPSHTRILNESPSSQDSLPGEEINRIPNPSDDAGRAVQHLPGVASSEASAAVNIRGGSPEETIIAIDGLELSEPFHLKDFFNVFSSLDATAIGRVDLMTGAFPVEWGDRMGGVVAMNLLSPAAPELTRISLGTLNGSFTSSGTTRDHGTSWLLSARGLYPDVVMNADREPSQQISTDLYDLLGKFEHRVGARTTASLTFLGAYDNLGYRNDKPAESAKSVAEETSAHVWLTMRTAWSDSTSVRSILAVGRLWRERTGSIAGSDALGISDSRGFNFVELKQDWRAALQDSQQFRFGFDAKSSDARYDYTRSGGATPPVDTHIRPHEQSVALYASDRIRLGSATVAELGIRWDRQSMAADSQLSPRLNVLWQLRPDSDLRLGWGRYYQSQRLNELQVEDGLTRLAEPELAEHRTVSFEHRFTPGLALRVEAFDKPMRHVRPRFENMLNPIDIFPEAQEDRVEVAPSRSRARGLELRLVGNGGGRVAWWVSYARSRATDTINGLDVSRSWDQPNAANGALSFEVSHGLSASMAGSYHTGWPTTPMIAVRTTNGVELVLGPRNSERLPPWFRVDARLSKEIGTPRGELAIILDVVNLTNHKNVCCVSDFSAIEQTDGTLGVARDNRALVPIFPSLTARWKF
ncbi:MAG: TonB-dependent receptor [Acidobacteriota bacterium]